MSRYDNVKVYKNKNFSNVGTAYLPKFEEKNSDVLLISTNGDKCDILAQQYYGDSSLWWAISSANPNLPQDSYYPPEGIQIRIPANVGNIVNNFELQNR